MASQSGQFPNHPGGMASSSLGKAFTGVQEVQNKELYNSREWWKRKKKMQQKKKKMKQATLTGDGSISASSATGAGNTQWLINSKGEAMCIKQLMTTGILPSLKVKSNVQTFLQRMSNVLKLSKVPKADWGKLAAARLEGPAQEFWQTKHFMPGTMTWDSFSSQIRTWAQTPERQKRKQKGKSGEEESPSEGGSRTSKRVRGENWGEGEASSQGGAEEEEGEEGGSGRRKTRSQVAAEPSERPRLTRAQAAASVATAEQDATPQARPLTWAQKKKMKRQLQQNLGAASPGPSRRKRRKQRRGQLQEVAEDSGEEHSATGDEGQEQGEGGEETWKTLHDITRDKETTFKKVSEILEVRPASATSEEASKDVDHNEQEGLPLMEEISDVEQETAGSIDKEEVKIEDNQISEKVEPTGEVKAEEEKTMTEKDAEIINESVKPEVEPEKKDNSAQDVTTNKFQHEDKKDDKDAPKSIDEITETKIITDVITNVEEDVKPKPDVNGEIGGICKDGNETVCQQLGASEVTDEIQKDMVTSENVAIEPVIETDNTEEAVAEPTNKVHTDKVETELINENNKDEVKSNQKEDLTPINEAEVQINSKVDGDSGTLKNKDPAESMKLKESESSSEVDSTVQDNSKHDTEPKTFEEIETQIEMTTDQINKTITNDGVNLKESTIKPLDETASMEMIEPLNEIIETENEMIRHDEEKTTTNVDISESLDEPAEPTESFDVKGETKPENTLISHSKPEVSQTSEETKDMQMVVVTNDEKITEIKGYNEATKDGPNIRMEDSQTVLSLEIKTKNEEPKVWKKDDMIIEKSETQTNENSGLDGINSEGFEITEMDNNKKHINDIEINEENGTTSTIDKNKGEIEGMEIEKPTDETKNVQFVDNNEEESKKDFCDEVKLEVESSDEIENKDKEVTDNCKNDEIQGNRKQELLPVAEDMKEMDSKLISDVALKTDNIISSEMEVENKKIETENYKVNSDGSFEKQPPNSTEETENKKGEVSEFTGKTDKQNEIQNSSSVKPIAESKVEGNGEKDVEMLEIKKVESQTEINQIVHNTEGKEPNNENQTDATDVQKSPTDVCSKMDVSEPLIETETEKIVVDSSDNAEEKIEEQIEINEAEKPPITEDTQHKISPECELNNVENLKNVEDNVQLEISSSKEDNSAIEVSVPPIGTDNSVISSQTESSEPKHAIESSPTDITEPADVIDMDHQEENEKVSDMSLEEVCNETKTTDNNDRAKEEVVDSDTAPVETENTVVEIPNTSEIPESCGLSEMEIHNAEGAKKNNLDKLNHENNGSSPKKEEMEHHNDSGIEVSEPKNQRATAETEVRKSVEEHDQMEISPISNEPDSCEKGLVEAENKVDMVKTEEINSDIVEAKADSLITDAETSEMEVSSPKNDANNMMETEVEVHSSSKKQDVIEVYQPTEKTDSLLELKDDEPQMDDSGKTSKITVPSNCTEMEIQETLPKEMNNKIEFQMETISETVIIKETEVGSKKGTDIVENAVIEIQNVVTETEKSSNCSDTKITHSAKVDTQNGLVEETTIKVENIKNLENDTALSQESSTEKDQLNTKDVIQNSTERNEEMELEVRNLNSPPKLNYTETKCEIFAACNTSATSQLCQKAELELGEAKVENPEIQSKVMIKLDNTDVKPTDPTDADKSADKTDDQTESQDITNSKNITEIQTCEAEVYANAPDEIEMVVDSEVETKTSCHDEKEMSEVTFETEAGSKSASESQHITGGDLNEETTKINADEGEFETDMKVKFGEHLGDNSEHEMETAECIKVTDDTDNIAAKNERKCNDEEMVTEVNTNAPKNVKEVENNIECTSVHHIIGETQKTENKVSEYSAQIDESKLNLESVEKKTMETEDDKSEIFKSKSTNEEAEIPKIKHDEPQMDDSGKTSEGNFNTVQTSNITVPSNCTEMDISDNSEAVNNIKISIEVSEEKDINASEVLSTQNQVDIEVENPEEKNSQTVEKSESNTDIKILSGTETIPQSQADAFPDEAEMKTSKTVCESQSEGEDKTENSKMCEDKNDHEADDKMICETEKSDEEASKLSSEVVNAIEDEIKHTNKTEETTMEENVTERNIEKTEMVLPNLTEQCVEMETSDSITSVEKKYEVCPEDEMEVCQTDELKSSEVEKEELQSDINKTETKVPNESNTAPKQNEEIEIEVSEPQNVAEGLKSENSKDIETEKTEEIQSSISMDNAESMKETEKNKLEVFESTIERRDVEGEIVKSEALVKVQNEPQCSETEGDISSKAIEKIETDLEKDEDSKTEEKEVGSVEMVSTDETSKNVESSSIEAVEIDQKSTNDQIAESQICKDKIEPSINESENFGCDSTKIEQDISETSTLEILQTNKEKTTSSVGEVALEVCKTSDEPRNVEIENPNTVEQTDTGEEGLGCKTIGAIGDNIKDETGSEIKESHERKTLDYHGNPEASPTEITKIEANDVSDNVEISSLANDTNSQIEDSKTSNEPKVDSEKTADTNMDEMEVCETHDESSMKTSLSVNDSSVDTESQGSKLCDQSGDAAVDGKLTSDPQPKLVVEKSCSVADSKNEEIEVPEVVNKCNIDQNNGKLSVDNNECKMDVCESVEIKKNDSTQFNVTGETLADASEEANQTNSEEDVMEVCITSSDHSSNEKTENVDLNILEGSDVTENDKESQKEVPKNTQKIVEKCENMEVERSDSQTGNSKTDIIKSVEIGINNKTEVPKPVEEGSLMDTSKTVGAINNEEVSEHPVHETEDVPASGSENDQMEISICTNNVESNITENRKSINQDIKVANDETEKETNSEGAKTGIPDSAGDNGSAENESSKDIDSKHPDIVNTAKSSDEEKVKEATDIAQQNEGAKPIVSEPVNGNSDGASKSDNGGNAIPEVESIKATAENLNSQIDITEKCTNETDDICQMGDTQCR